MQQCCPEPPEGARPSPGVSFGREAAERCLDSHGRHPYYGGPTRGYNIREVGSERCLVLPRSPAIPPLAAHRGGLLEPTAHGDRRRSCSGQYAVLEFHPERPSASSQRRARAPARPACLPRPRRRRPACPRPARPPPGRRRRCRKTGRVHARARGRANGRPSWGARGPALRPILPPLNLRRHDRPE